MENCTQILDDEKETSYSIILKNERRKRIPIYFIGYGMIIGAFLWGGLDPKFFSGILFFGSIFIFYEIMNWQAIYHISNAEEHIRLYILDFLGRKNEISLYENDVRQVRVNHLFNSIQIPQYNLQLPLEEKKFKILVLMIQNLALKKQH